MTLKSRLERMERRTVVAEPLVTYFRTFYENATGGLDAEICSATFGGGPLGGAFFSSEDAETFEEFHARMEFKARGDKRSLETTERESRVAALEAGK